MPVDTSAINTILGAYAQGAQLKQRKDDAAMQNQRDIEAQKLAKARLEAEIKQNEAALKKAEERFKADQEFKKKQQEMATASHKLSVIGARAQIAEHIQKSGVTPPGFKRELAGVDPDSDSIYYKYSSEEDPSLNVVLPSGITYARQQAAAQEEAMRPQREFEAQKATARAQLEAQKLVGQHQSKMLVEEAKTVRQRESDQKRYDAMREVANIRARAAKNPAAKAAAEYDKPLSLTEIDALNNANPDKKLQFGATRRDAVGLNVEAKTKETEGARKDREYLDKIEETAEQAKKLITSNKEFKEYFAGKGASGALKELGRRWESKTTQNLAKARALLGQLTAIIGNKNFGASFTGNEKEILRTFVPGETRSQIYEEVITQLDLLLENARKTRAITLGGKATLSAPKIDKAEAAAQRYSQ